MTSYNAFFVKIESPCLFDKFQRVFDQRVEESSVLNLPRDHQNCRHFDAYSSTTTANHDGDHYCDQSIGLSLNIFDVHVPLSLNTEIIALMIDEMCYTTNCAQNVTLS